MARHKPKSKGRRAKKGRRRAPAVVPVTPRFLYKFERGERGRRIEQHGYGN